MIEGSPASDTIPLVLDVDGTLIRSDLTHEMLLKGFCDDPWNVPKLALLGLRSKPALKEILVARIGDRLAVEVLPLEPKIIALAKKARQAGREVYLCSGSEDSLVKRLAARLDFVTDGYGTTPELNLTSGNKAAFLQSKFSGGFDYAGNSTQDYAVWAVARTAYAIRPPGDTSGRVSASGAPVHILERRRKRIGLLLRAMRPRLWALNLPVFTALSAPLIMGEGQVASLGSVFAMFGSLSAATSAAVLLNSLRDIQVDRYRAGYSESLLAAGLLSVPAALLAALTLALGACLITAAVSGLMGIAALVLYAVVALARFGRKASEPGFGLLTRLLLILLSLVFGLLMETGAGG